MEENKIIFSLTHQFFITNYIRKNWFQTWGTNPSLFSWVWVATGFLLAYMAKLKSSKYKNGKTKILTSSMFAAGLRPFPVHR